MGGDTIDISKSRRRIVFLGTPSVAADCCLQILSDNAFPNLAKSEYEIVAVVTQPPAPAGNNIISNLIIDIYQIIKIMKEEIRN
jgi:methionyl-tRNA formyltransferase